MMEAEGKFMDQVNCPYCESSISATAIKCPHCAEFVKGRRAGRPSAGGGRWAEDTGGTDVFIVALLGWLVCGILHPFAWSMGNRYEANCIARRVHPSGLGKAGKILGQVGTYLLFVALALFVVMFLVGVVGQMR